VNPQSFSALREILLWLKRDELRGLFFLTGHVTEKLSSYPDVVEMLQDHEIGYHSTSHSIRPTIIEYTDVPSYEEAVKAVLARETSYVNPFTGKTEEKGGIIKLKNLFPDKSVSSFRAPGFCWAPTAGEALKQWGIRFDFSLQLSNDPVYYNGTTFYPFPLVIGLPEGNDLNYKTYTRFLHSVLTRQVTVVDIHPQSLRNRNFWDRIFWSGHPDRLTPTEKKSREEEHSTICRFKILVKMISSLKKTHTIEVTPPLYDSCEIFKPTSAQIRDVYQRSLRWARRFLEYDPRFQWTHYLKFFGLKK